MLPPRGGNIQFQTLGLLAYPGGPGPLS